MDKRVHKVVLGPEVYVGKRGFMVQQGSLDEGLELYRDALRQFGGKRPKLEEKIKSAEARLAAARRGGGKKKKKDVLAGLDSSDEDSDASFNVRDVL